MQLQNVFNLPSGRIFVSKTHDGYPIESTEMQDVSIDGKEHEIVRETTDPRIIWQHLVPHSKKWLMTVSTQKGCTHHCKFCDVAPLPFKGNLTQEEIEWQIKMILTNTTHIQQSEKVKIGFARMGEPSWNLTAVLNAMRNLPNLSKDLGKDFNWLPCFNSILPRQAPCLDEVLEVKERDYNGFLHLQISCNSTDEEKRKELFGGAKVLSIEEILKALNSKTISNRTVTLNFIVMKGVELDVQKLKKMGLNKEKFSVKLIPLNRTDNAESHSLQTLANYSNYQELVKLRDEFKHLGIPTVMDAIARCEEAGLCCGQTVQEYFK